MKEKPILKVYKSFKRCLKVYEAVRAVSRSGSSVKTALIVVVIVVPHTGCGAVLSLCGSGAGALNKL
jgi:carbonic anhydrase